MNAKEARDIYLGFSSDKWIYEFIEQNAEEGREFCYIPSLSNRQIEDLLSKDYIITKVEPSGYKVFWEYIIQ